MKLFREFVNIPEEEDYPQGFSFGVLEGLTAYSKKVAYVKSHLRKLGAGSSREVYEVDEEKVLKLAKNKKGLIQNESEGEPYKQNYSVIAKVFEYDPEYYWVEMERAKKVTPKSFKAITGITLNDLHTYLYIINLVERRAYPMSKNDKLFVDKMNEVEIVQSLMDFVRDYQFPIPGDFGRTSTWGQVVRDGKWEVVVVDFGFDANAVAAYA